MRWRGGRRSGNIIDQRGAGSGGGGGLGGLDRLKLPSGRGMPGPMGIPIGRGGMGRIILMVIVLVVISLLYERFVGTGDQTTQLPPGQEALTPEQDELADFVAVVLAETEDVWNAQFAADGGDYAEPQLVLFTNSVGSACGFADAAVGPFYCPGDRRVYLDLSFFDALARRHNAAGDFAQAYVIAHEIGHHVQNLIGILPEANQRQQALPEAEANAVSVAVELQADCFAGVWAHYADAEQLLEPGDIEEALAAASAVGDDTLQRRGQGYVVPESFTHGTSAQRMAWFTKGFESGNPDSCDTFGN